MSRPSYVATAGGFCMAGSSHPAKPVDTANAEAREADEALQDNAEETQKAEQGAAESH